MTQPTTGIRGCASAGDTLFGEPTGGQGFGQPQSDDSERLPCTRNDPYKLSSRQAYNFCKGFCDRDFALAFP